MPACPRLRRRARVAFRSIVLFAVLSLFVVPAANAAGGMFDAQGYLYDDDYGRQSEAGANVNLEFELSNWDAVPSGPITLRATLPATSTYRSATMLGGGSCGFASQVVTCTLPSLGVGDYAFPRLVVSAPTTPGDYTVSYTVTSGGGTWTVLPIAGLEGSVWDPRAVDLGIRAYPAASDGRSELRAAQPFVISIQPREYLGRTFATPPTWNIVVDLPSGISFTATPGPAQVPLGTTCQATAQRLTCAGPVASGWAPEIVASAIASNPGEFHGLATIASDGVEQDAADNARDVLFVVHPSPVVDACGNIDGVQASVPAGLVPEGGACVTPKTQTTTTTTPAADVCTNITGVQAVLPAGFGFAPDGTCTSGSARADRITGSAAADVLAGGAGNDWLFGGLGPDTLRGGVGNDQLLGGGGPDLLDGGVGNDRLDGGPGIDRYFGGVGNDVIVSRDKVERERVSCGAGRDVATVDRRDIVGKDCEVIRRK